ncbi:hypothetical protein RI820_000825 [Pluralibacter gergoviae]|nr:hypothetical protein [Pluralibacter gergoviae]ELC3015972.1 hypothetical protein [Pluralibacter gergoviae]ELC3020951.1 hypothetical protein [Pluralibacter gergoviae]ELO7478931.1 hypothetical protein [Pluralibacter gergoviae]ELW9440979.1 hypothetical protein [Pluralibacter gergoviae]
MMGVSTMVQFEFCETTFTARCRWSACDLGRQVRLSLRDMQALYPELAHWSLLALSCGWDSYAGDRLVPASVGGVTRIRDEGFLAYCYVRQRWPGFSFSSAGSLAPQLRALGAARPWQLTPPPAKPDWVTP